MQLHPSFSIAKEGNKKRTKAREEQDERKVKVSRRKFSNSACEE
jgi:hypothetical protein